MKKTRLALSEPLTEALIAIAQLEGRALTHVVEHLLREQLKEMGVLKPPTPEQLEEARKIAGKKIKVPASKPRPKRLVARAV